MALFVMLLGACITVAGIVLLVKGLASQGKNEIDIFGLAKYTGNSPSLVIVVIGAALVGVALNGFNRQSSQSNPASEFTPRSSSSEAAPTQASTAPDSDRTGSSSVASGGTPQSALVPLIGEASIKTAHIMRIASEGNESAVREYLKQYPSMASATDDTGQTPLMAAAREGRLQVVRALVELGATINAEDNGGTTALILASMNSHQPVVEYLLDHGADANASDNDGKTALSWAFSAEVSEALRKHGGR